MARLDKDGRHWQTYNTASTNGGLPDNRVRALAPGADGALWIGTQSGGLARLDKDGRWQSYSTASTNRGLPDDTVLALTFGADGALWIGTWGGGLARLDKEGRHWQTYRMASTNGGLPADRVVALAPGADGAIWIGTADLLSGGLARLDKDGRWQTYRTASTNGGLPDDRVIALAPGADGALWFGTLGGGLGYFRRPTTPTHRIVEVIGKIGKVSQKEQTVSVVAFDSSYRTEPWMFRYVWRKTEVGHEPDPEKRTRSPVYKDMFDHDGDYQLQVIAIDRYGEWSKPRPINFRVALPDDPTREMLVKAAWSQGWFVFIFFILIFLLIPLYPRYSWARTAVNSGWFTKYPYVHKFVLNTRWARGYLFRQLAAKASAAAVPKPYISQSLFAAAVKGAKPLTLDGSLEGLTQLFSAQCRRALLVARSGTGKSVFLRHLHRRVGARFQRGERVPVPVLIDLKTHNLHGHKVQDLVRDVLHGARVELRDRDLDYLIGKGGFLILVDSLNELPQPADDAPLFHAFFNKDAGNFVMVASQVDLIRRPDTPLFNLAEVTPEQAASYLAEAVGHDVYAELPSEAQLLARNPQDLKLIAEAEVTMALGPARVPTHRAKLYSEILEQDSALKPWVESSDPLLAVVYGLAFRMVAERRVLRNDQLPEWIAADPAASGDAVAKVVQAVQTSRLFGPEVVRDDDLGKEKPGTGFRHELIGKFLAARHVRRMIEQGVGSTAVGYISLSGDELWLDMFYFVIDEIDSSPVLDRFLQEILAAGGGARMRITAYAIGTRRAELGSQVLASYEKAKLDEDLALTPAA